MRENLNGKTVLVTGGATGIGWATASALADEGCSVVIAGRRAEKLEEALRNRPSDGRMASFAVDVADRAGVEQMFAWFLERFHGIDILVNAAGVNIKSRSMSQMAPEQWDEVMAINATGAYNCIYAALPAMREKQAGIIVNISSISGKRALDLGGVAYCASKFAMSALGTAVGQEEAAHGIRVTNVYPGEVDTPLLAQRPSPVSDDHRARMLQPHDVAEMIVAIVALPARAHVPEIVVKPRLQAFC